MMREALDQWPFVYAAYTIGITGILGTVIWAWIDMKRAERRRDAVRSGHSEK